MSDAGSETAAVEIVQTTARKRWTAAQKFRTLRGQTVRSVARAVAQESEACPKKQFTQNLKHTRFIEML